MAGKTRKKTGRPFVYGVENDFCVWSRAGVVKPVKCINAFDCLSCTFDRKVLTDFAMPKSSPDDDITLREPPRLRLMLTQMKCRHMLSGRIDYKLCGHGYNCVQCPYDQMLEETSFAPGLKAPFCETVSGFSVARDYYYHFGHAWARVEYGGRVRVGMDDFTMRLFGPQDRIVIPGLGRDVKQGAALATMRRGNNTAVCLSPVDGKVVAFNYKIAGEPEISHQKPYSDGWMVVIQPANLRKNLKNLFFGIESLTWMDEEATRLNTLLNNSAGYKMAATGGTAISDIYGNAGGMDWNRLAEEFLG
ncbi:MAG: glycine cleavage system protein H [Desulfobacteraceae bacterium]|nr:glycine cleavage system protein H [Desulfobacteraceae bacterium]